jgi:outer membrane protein
MKPFSAVLVSLALGSALAAAQAPASHPPAESTAAGPTKVAVIEFQAAVGQTNEFQRDFADVQKKFDPKRQQLKALSDEVDTLTKQLQTQGSNLSEDERESRARAIDEKKKQLDRDSQDAQQDFQSDLQELLNRIASKVGAVMTDYAQKRGFTLVLDRSESEQGGAPTVLYAAPSTDITKGVIDAYNEKSGIPAPPAASAPAPDAPAPQPATKPAPKH